MRVYPRYRDKDVRTVRPPLLQWLINSEFGAALEVLHFWFN
jgi:hypothetical protein